MTSKPPSLRRVKSLKARDSGFSEAPIKASLGINCKTKRIKIWQNTMGGIMKVEVLVTISYPMIRHYFFNALENPQTLNLFGRVLESLFWRVFFLVACSILLLFVWYSVYLLIKKHSLTSRRKNLTLSELKNSFLLSYEKRKGSFSKSRYLILWAVLQLLSWSFVRFYLWCNVSRTRNPKYKWTFCYQYAFRKVGIFLFVDLYDRPLFYYVFLWE